MSQGNGPERKNDADPKGAGGVDSLAAELASKLLNTCSYKGKFFPFTCSELRYAESEGKPFCVLHYPSKDKLEPFNKFVEERIASGNFNFHGAWIPGDFLILSKKICEKLVNFDEAIFNERAIFIRTEFLEGASFNWVRFESRAHFSESLFVKQAEFARSDFMSLASFNNTKFGGGANFHYAEFNGEVEFRIFDVEDAALGGDNFKHANLKGDFAFTYVTFKDYAKFYGDRDNLLFDGEANVKFRHAIVEKPERIVFDTVRLKPHWFVGIDPRKFSFASIEWLEIDVEEEFNKLGDEGVRSPHAKLAKAFRELAINHEENQRYDDASNCRYLSQEVLRIGGPPEQRVFSLHWWYWAASGYGERVIRALLVLVAIWLIFAFSYTRVSFSSTERSISSATKNEMIIQLDFGHALLYSFQALTLQKPEPKPATMLGQALVSLESVLGPIQVALLALAIRRKFMK